MGQNNYAFIDGHNLYLGIMYQALELDLKKFRIFLKDKFSISKAFYFIGFIPGNYRLYKKIRDAGFIIKLRRVAIDDSGNKKGNVDSELVFNTLIKIDRYDKAVIVAGDADYYCMIKYLDYKNKLLRIIIPDKDFCPKVYKNQRFHKYLLFLNFSRNRLSL